jgi:hypothetical protein
MLSLTTTTVCVPSSQSAVAACSKLSKFSFAASLQCPQCPATACLEPSDLSLAVSRSKPSDYSVTTITSMPRLTAATCSKTANITIHSKLPDLSLTAAHSKSLKFSLVAVIHISSSRSLASAHSKPAKSSTAIITS